MAIVLPPPKKIIVPILLLVISGLVFFAGVIFMSEIGAVPLFMPLNMQVSDVSSPSFSINKSGDYTIGLEVDRTIPFDDLEQLLGNAIYIKDEAHFGKSAVDLRWVLRQNGRLIDSGTSANQNGGSYGKTITKHLGMTTLVCGSGYVLEVKTLIDGSPLLPAHPRIIVTYDNRSLKGRFVLISLAMSVSLVTGFCGVVWMLAIVFIRKNIQPR